ncbi:MAG TPA: GPR endopeptidase [Ruminococcaceae bacterium]|nr:GPR endopeptidase [Oscillospiraceae bacterium]
MVLRTDLAIEARELAGENVSGVEFNEYRRGGMKLSKLKVKNAHAKQTLGKDPGTYITVELPSLTDNFSDADERIEIIGGEIRKLLPVNGLLLVAGLGNMEITPDSLGPKTGLKVLATRHISGEISGASGLENLRPVAVVQTGVTGQTGIETGEYLQSLVKTLKPTALIVIDALASRRLERLGRTLQISDAGISPGAGVGNHRMKISRETMGVPVIAIGVPTVVDVKTLAGDLLGSRYYYSDANALEPGGRQMIVTPREIDLLTERASRLIGFALNAAIQDKFSLSELVSLM